MQSVWLHWLGNNIFVKYEIKYLWAGRVFTKIWDQNPTDPLGNTLSLTERGVCCQVVCFVYVFRDRGQSPEHLDAVCRGTGMPAKPVAIR